MLPGHERAAAQTPRSRPRRDVVCLWLYDIRMIVIRDALPSDYGAILRLNEESVHYLSPLTRGALQALASAAAYHRVVEVDQEVAAFLLVLPPGVDYGSINYRWFTQQYEHFLYVDRVVVARIHQGNGLGRRLYEDLFEFARRHQVPRITCEFDIDPPNEASRLFHTRYGFAEVGTQALEGGVKRVSLQAAELSTPT